MWGMRSRLRLAVIGPGPAAAPFAAACTVLFIRPVDHPLILPIFACEYRFRICYSDTSTVQEDQYPPNIAVKVNQFYCHVPVRSGNKPNGVVRGGGWKKSRRCIVRNECDVVRWVMLFNSKFMFGFQGYYPSNKPGVEPRRPCRPINITPWMHLSTSTNCITVTWGNFGKVWLPSESVGFCWQLVLDFLKFSPGGCFTE